MSFFPDVDPLEPGIVQQVIMCEYFCCGEQSFSGGEDAPFNIHVMALDRNRLKISYVRKGTGWPYVYNTPFDADTDDKEHGYFYGDIELDKYFKRIPTEDGQAFVKTQSHERTTDGRYVTVTTRTDGKTVITEHGSVRPIDPRTVELESRKDGKTVVTLVDEVHHGDGDSKRPAEPTGYEPTPPTKKHKTSKWQEPPRLAAPQPGPRRQDIGPAVNKAPPATYRPPTPPTYKTTKKTQVTPRSPSPPYSPATERMDESEKDEEEDDDNLLC